MSLVWTVIFVLGFISFKYSECKNDDLKNNLPSAAAAVVVGTVYCDTCFHQNFPKPYRYITGASVAVECYDKTKSSLSFREEVKTDKHGEFKVDLPFSVGRDVKKIEGCSVKLISSNEPYCAVAAEASSASLNLKSRKEGMHIFSAGFFTFKPLKQPDVCARFKNDVKKRTFDDQKSSILNPSDTTFPPPIQGPAVPYRAPVYLGQYLPPLPRLPPLPQLPRLPPLPGIPFFPPLPEKRTTVYDQSWKTDQLPVFVPNPLNPTLPNPLNPPSIFPPNPFQPPPALLPPVVPSPPASIFPPVFPTPPATTFPPLLPNPWPAPPMFNLPPLPGFTPPSPPPPQSFPIPFPPFPFQPTPGFPGVPPADVSSTP